MNWYETQMRIHKEAQFWKGFLKGNLIGLAPLLLWLEYSRGDISRLINNTNPQEVEQTINKIIEEGKERNAPDFVWEQVEENIRQNEEKTKQQIATKEKQEQFDYENFKERLAQYEGNKNKAFRVGNTNEIDIGMGHVMYHPHMKNPTAHSRRVFQKLFGDSVNFDRVLAGQQILTKEQLEKLNNYEIDRHLFRAKKMFPQFNDFPQAAQFAILDAIYRGDMGPKTAKLINEEKYEQATKEYLNHKGYEKAIERGLPGIRTRMESNRDDLLSLIN